MSLSLAMLIGASAWGYDFKSEGLCYNIINDTEQPYKVEVCYESLNNNYKGLTSVSIPYSVNFSGLTFNVTGVGDRAFYSCTDLTNVVLPDGMDSIGAESFRGCTNLSSIAIPETIKISKNMLSMVVAILHYSIFLTL